MEALGACQHPVMSRLHRRETVCAQELAPTAAGDHFRLGPAWTQCRVKNYGAIKVCEPKKTNINNVQKNLCTKCDISNLRRR